MGFTYEQAHAALAEVGSGNVAGALDLIQTRGGTCPMCSNWGRSQAWVHQVKVAAAWGK